MESSLSEEVPLAAEDAQLPDMVPVSIRTTSLPEFQHCSLDRVLAGVLLTWKEFLQLFDIRVEVTDYVIRGTNGMKFQLTEKVQIDNQTIQIQDYVNSFRRKLKLYQVTLERTNNIVEATRGQRGSVHSEGSSYPTKTSYSTDGRLAGSSKKPKLMDEDKRKRNHRKMTKESLEKIAQNVMMEQSAVTKRPNVKKGDIKRDSVNKSRSPTPPTMAKVADIPPAASYPHDLVTVKVETQLSSGKLKRLSIDHSQVKEIVPSSSSSSIVAKRGRKQRNASSILSSRRSTKESLNTVVESNQEESSETEDEEFPSKDKKKLLKQNVIKYLTDKVSPRSFLRLRNELMELRDHEKYFKVTSVVPMTAGMMEQAFCRKLTD